MVLISFVPRTALPEPRLVPVRYRRRVSRLPVESVSLLVGATWGLAGIFWVVIRRWERTGVTEARRRELEGEGSEAVSPAIRAWRWMTVAITAAIPLLFAVDGFVDRIEILYAPELSFFAGPDLGLQIAGIVLSAAGLAILIVVGRKLAVNVYRRASDEREMMTTGAHRFVRHPFYIHFLVLPLGFCLLTLNYLALLVLAAYTTLWEPMTVVGWMRLEEDGLRRRYGDEAEAYLSRTGRVFPRLRRR
jgi:protein-S-isoprenylcysteine O-methyltransferase Ste14